MTVPKRLTVGQARSLKTRLAIEQVACPLCNKSFNDLLPVNIVLDHDHTNGQVRGVLCRGCNGAEGRAINAVGRWGGVGMGYVEIIAWLENLLVYLKQEPLPFIYPTHLTEAEKKAKAALKRRQAAARKTRGTR